VHIQEERSPRERKRCLHTCTAILRCWAEEDGNQKRRGRSHESISREEGGPEEAQIRVANQWRRGRKAQIVKEALIDGTEEAEW
jgi:hypothetical protein